MGAPYSSQAISNYNSNPPADDGSTASTNRITWAGTKTKLADPIKTLAEAIDSATSSAFQKVLGGASVTSVSTDYTVQSSDQGKLVRATASLTLTTPDASTVASPFVFAVNNGHSASVTFNAFSGQTIDGSSSTTIAAGAGMVVFTDGTNWFTTGQQGTLVGKQLMYGDIINGTISESNATNAVTYSLKTLAGSNPSSSDPVLVSFRNATAGTGNYVYRTVTSALSLTISSGSTLGFSNGTAGRVWIGLLDNGGTVEMFAVNCLSGSSIYPLGQFPIISTTAEGGAGAADSAQVPYSTTARTSKAYVVLGYAEYASGLATAGSWNVSPDRIQLFGPGIPLPGQHIQIQQTTTATNASGTTTIPFDNTIPQNTEGDQYMTRAITPTSAANLLKIDVQAGLGTSAALQAAAALFQDTTANALTAVGWYGTNAGANSVPVTLSHAMLAGTTSSTTFKFRAGGISAGTVYFNSQSSGALFNGTFNSYMRVTELMA